MTTQVETINKIKEIIQEYADCQEELDLTKTAVAVYELARETDGGGIMKHFLAQSAMLGKALERRDIKGE